MLRSPCRPRMNNSAVPPLMTIPSAGDPDHGPARNLGRLSQAVDRFHRDAADRDKQQAGIDQGGEDRGPAIAVGVGLRRPPGGEPRPAPRQQQGKHVGQVMDGVGNQCQRIGGIAEGKLGGHEHAVEHRADRKGPAEIDRRMVVAGVIVPVGMIVVMRHQGNRSRWFRRPRYTRGKMNTITVRVSLPTPDGASSLRGATATKQSITPRMPNDGLLR